MTNFEHPSAVAGGWSVQRTVVNVSCLCLSAAVQAGRRLAVRVNAQGQKLEYIWYAAQLHTSDVRSRAPKSNVQSLPSSALRHQVCARVSTVVPTSVQASSLQAACSSTPHSDQSIHHTSCNVAATSN